ncbi:hypothetical protein A33Q_2892 [Indibacter alkaliphilus LW1]|uniref:Uncharacterized protein n=1 Tax=Indibacter alkaliphilus (strain CCUG 57479 / KCTC 22604 / LW1) TaxID=1189612 RepID=S2DEV1_INDAL|nr:hypothetical protein [Indibacter alkaliphilus]EOZ95530.1 hypothetical protein A33Q_2892 [Indibacter alkaliphilus LW1]
MSKNLVISLLLFHCLSPIYGQSCGNDGFWKIGTTFGTKRLSSNCGDFNCHGFAAAYWESGLNNSFPAWNSAVPGNVTVTTPFRLSTGGPSENYFQNSSKYVQICNQSLTNVDVVSQNFGTSIGKHSLVRDKSTSSFGLKFISKYGSESPVIGHEFEATWYELNNAVKIEPDKFYAYVGKLPPNLILPQNQTNAFFNATRELCIF